MEVLFHVFYYYWGEEYRLLYRGLRYIEVLYIEVPLVALRWNDFLAVLGDRQKQKIVTLATVCYLLFALFINMRTLKLKSRLHNCVFHCRQS